MEERPPVWRVAANKQAAQNVNGERFNLRKLNELEVGETVTD
jgi:hypothetical protein